jgi:hypothetical protein
MQVPQLSMPPPLPTAEPMDQVQSVSEGDVEIMDECPHEHSLGNHILPDSMLYMEGQSEHATLDPVVVNCGTSTDPMGKGPNGDNIPKWKYHNGKGPNGDYIPKGK